jgi:hypothetical protein
LIVVVVHAVLGNRVHHYLDAAQLRLKQVEAALDRVANQDRAA